MNVRPIYVAFVIVIVLLLLALFTLMQGPGQRGDKLDISFSQLLTEVDAGKVRDVTIQGSEIHGNYNDGRGAFQTYIPFDPTLVPRLHGKGVMIYVRPRQDDTPWVVSLLASLIPFGIMIALIGIWVNLARRQGSKS